MVLDDFRDRAVEAVGDMADAAKAIGSEAAKRAAQGLEAAAGTAQKVQRDMRKAHYNPLFPEDYQDPQFKLPSMIVIADEAEREDIDVCEGAIGWLSEEGDLDVLHLYEECIPYSGLEFLPTANLGAAYYVDTFNKNRFIDLSKYFDIAQKEKITELRNVAHKLGAKECRLESYEADKSIQIKKAKGKAKGNPKGIDVKVEGEFSESSGTNREQSILLVQHFEGSSDPSRPILQWYKTDAEVNSLIEMFCGDKAHNPTKDYEIKIDGSASETLSQSMAIKLDTALKKLGAACNFSLEGEAKRESRSQLVFKMTF